MPCQDQRRLWWSALLSAAGWVMVVPALEAADKPAPDAVAKVEPVRVEPGPRWVLDYFPETELYAPYKADLHRPVLALVHLGVSRVGIAEAGDTRLDVRIGGCFGLFRVRPAARSEVAWQLSLAAGFDTQLDLQNNYDSIGWDGNIGLFLTTVRGRALSFKTGIYHTSSHVADEHIERTGRQRLGYTRTELVAGISWAIIRRWRLYGEGGWGFELRQEDIQKPGRAQIGVEYESEESLSKGRLGWYAAADVSATEERDWSADVSLQAGVLIRSGNRRWRMGAGYYDGRSTLGEFFQDDERYTTLGLWLEL